MNNISDEMKYNRTEHHKWAKGFLNAKRAGSGREFHPYTRIGFKFDSEKIKPNI